MKNLIVIILLFFLYGCGYTSIYKDQKSREIFISVINTDGDTVINNYLKNQLNILSDKESVNIFNISFVSKYERTTIAKDSAGVATDYRLVAEIEFNINKNGVNKIITFTENINIKNEGENFEQRNYENSIKRNFVLSIKNKLVTYLNNFDDN